MSAAVWSQLSNSQSLPTDCDNRNERRGWLGDAAYSCDEALFNLDYANFYINFLQLIADAQMEYGAVPPQVPYTVHTGFPADPNWSAAQLNNSAAQHCRLRHLCCLPHAVASLLSCAPGAPPTRPSRGGSMTITVCSFTRRRCPASHALLQH